jgi:TonB-linked SusC/RagA family outer membrane protein
MQVMQTNVLCKAFARYTNCLKLHTKTLMIMKFTAFLLLVACLQVSARTSAQTVSLSEKNVRLEKIFQEIKKQTKYVFFYDAKLVATAPPVTIDLKNVTVETVLNESLKGLSLGYSIENKTVTIVKKNEAKSVTPDLSPGLLTAPPPANIDVTITVLNTDNQPLEGASIIIKGNSKGIITDIQGRATLKNIDKDANIIVSFTGFQNQEIKINNRTAIAVRLLASTSELDEVQIGAYSKTSKRFQTGNTTTVKREDISKQPVQNPLLALQGRVAGLFVTQSSGFPGSSVKVRLQGQNSIQSGNDPLYVIDGIPYSSQMLASVAGGPYGNLIFGSTSSTNAPGGTGSPLNYINPADIESITVLKDADATAIYGSKAANGAILIATKKGKAGNTQVDLDIQTGWGKITKTVDLLNTPQYMQMRREAISNAGLSVGATDYDVNGFWDSTRSTDWQKALLGKTSRYNTANLSMSGGSNTIQFMIGSSFHLETPIVPGPFSDRKGGLHFNISSISTNGKFKTSLSGNYVADENQLPSFDFTLKALTLPPNAPAIYNLDGSLNWMPDASGNSTWENPMANLNIKYKNNTDNLLANISLSYQVLKGLEIKVTGGYNKLSTNEFTGLPLSIYSPETRVNSSRTAYYSNSTASSWIIEPQIVFNKNVGAGKLEILGGATYQQRTEKGISIYGIQYNSDAVMEDMGSAATLVPTSSIQSQYRYNAGFGRVNYNWKNQVIINLSGRRDASSRFGDRNKFHDFGSAGLAWLISESGFMKSRIPTISFLKVRASYGATGNDQIGDYSYMNLYNPLNVGINYQNALAVVPKGLTNPYLQWEETKKLQAGIDVGVFRDKLLINASYSINTSSNQLLNYTLPVMTGFRTILENFPAKVRNKQLEIELATKNIERKNFSWSSSLNLTIPKNALVDFPNLSTSSYSSYLVVGQPVTILKVFHFTGVNSLTGNYSFSDGKGGTTSRPDTALSLTRTTLINLDPKFYGGFQNSITYKRFSLDILFQFVKQIAPLNYYLSSGSTSPGSVKQNQPISVLNRWQKPGDQATIQRFISNSSLNQQLSSAYASDANYGDGSYVRLKNVSVSWTMPGKWTSKVRIADARLYVQGQNLLTITKYKGLDPENRSGYPPLKLVVVGATVRF